MCTCSGHKVHELNQRWLTRPGHGALHSLRFSSSRPRTRHTLHVVEQVAPPAACDRASAPGFCTRFECRQEEEREKERQKEEARSRRAAAKAGQRGPVPGPRGSYRAQRTQLQQQRAEVGGKTRGPLPGEESRRVRREQLQSDRAEMGGGIRGPLPGEGAGGRPEEEESRRVRREQLQSDRAEVGGKTRGPLPGEGAGGRPENRGGHGPPYLNEAHLPDVDVQKMYEDFLRSWARFGLSRVCQSCKTLTPAKQCRPSGPSRISTCRNCLESKNKIHLPGLPPIPAALRALKPIEHHLLAMARISQIVLDKLPSGGPSAQWGRMYAILMQEPCICDVLDGAVLEDDGTVSVQGVDGLTASSARLEHLRRALHELQMQHTLYQHNPAVQRVLDKMDSILQHRSSEAMAQLTAEGKESRETEEGEDELQFTYLVPKDPKVPRADASELRQTRGSAQLADDIDVKFFPQLFPDGTNGWKDSYKSFSQYARKRLLGQDGRFEQSASYIMWLLETQLKKRLSGNVNVRVGSQQKPAGCHGYQDGSRRVYTALRDIPGTQPYIYAKKGIALNMYEQLGQPQFSSPSPAMLASQASWPPSSLRDYCD